MPPPRPAGLRLVYKFRHGLIPVMIKSYIIWKMNYECVELGGLWLEYVDVVGGVWRWFHYCGVIMGAMASQITSLTIVYSTVHSGADQRKHQSSASLAFVRGIHRWPVTSPHKWPVAQKKFPFHDVIMSPPVTSLRTYSGMLFRVLTHWGRVTHICVGNLTITGSDNGLSPGRRQAIIWTNVGIVLIGPLGTQFSEILMEILTFSFKKRHLKLSSAKCWPFCLGLNVFTHRFAVMYILIVSLFETGFCNISANIFFGFDAAWYLGIRVTRGGYSLYEGYYICSTISTPSFSGPWKFV